MTFSTFEEQQNILKPLFNLKLSKDFVLSLSTVIILRLLQYFMKAALQARTECGILKGVAASRTEQYHLMEDRLRHYSKV